MEKVETKGDEEDMVEDEGMEMKMKMKVMGDVSRQEQGWRR